MYASGPPLLPSDSAVLIGYANVGQRSAAGERGGFRCPENCQSIDVTGKTHIAGGAFVAAVIATLAPMVPGAEVILAGSLQIGSVHLPVFAVGGAVCIIASLLPDIDEPESLIVNSPAAMRKRLRRSPRVQGKTLRGALDLVFIVARWLLRLASGMIRILAGGHRGATHWLLTAAILSAGVSYLGGLSGYSWLWIWFAAGYLSHLGLDMLTPSGLEVLRPLTSSSIHLLPGFMRIRTGGGADVLLRVLLIAGVGALVYKPLFNL